MWKYKISAAGTDYKIFNQDDDEFIAFVSTSDLADQICREHNEKIENQEITDENIRLKDWVRDLQSGMFINCVYCGHRYGPADMHPATLKEAKKKGKPQTPALSRADMADALRKHIANCEHHPMHHLRLKLENAEKIVALLYKWHLNTSIENWEEIAEEFYRDTHYLRPGKSESPATWYTGKDEKRLEAWHEWVAKKEVERRNLVKDFLRIK